MDALKAINDRFDMLIEGSLYPEDLIVNKELFNLTAGFTIDDWRVIHTPKYFRTKDAMYPREKTRYTLRCVKHYLKGLSEQ